VLIDQENKIMDEKGEHFPRVSITNDDIARIAIAVKDILKLDIEATVEKTIIEKQIPLLEKIEALKIKKNINSKLSVRRYWRR
jgi:hypothetical protein